MPGYPEAQILLSNMIINACNVACVCVSSGLSKGIKIQRFRVCGPLAGPSMPT